MRKLLTYPAGSPLESEPCQTSKFRYPHRSDLGGQISNGDAIQHSKMVSATSWPKTQTLNISRTVGALLLGGMPRMLSVCSLGPGSDTLGPFPTPTLKENQTMMWFSLFAAPAPPPAMC